jgi:acetylornithine/N-succinyldiaminopimelate aminotransferase
MGRNQEIVERGKKVLVGNYKQAPIAIVRGEGCRAWDADGKRYLDMVAGIAVNALGHCHPALVSALEKQAHEVWHTANGFYTEPAIRLAERLVANTFADRVFFCNSGAEANEALLKMARRYHFDRGEDRTEIVAFEKSFHGRSLFTVTCTGQPKYWQGFGPMVPGVKHAKFGDLASVEALVGPHTAAILVEPVQGEGGVLPAPKGFLKGLRELADRTGALLLFDEVQTGVGRTGELFAYMHEGVIPDALSSAKALGGGFPIGAILAKEEVCACLVPGTHASTFGGNPLACACGNVVLDQLLDHGVLANARAVGEYLHGRLVEMGKRLGPSKVVAVRGLGLLQGVELPKAPAETIAKARELGLLVNAAGASVVRMVPPLVLTREEADEAVDLLEKAIAATV